MFRQVLASLFLIISACTPSKTEQNGDSDEFVKKKDVYAISGENEPLDTILVQKGKVLIAYNDCYQCHREDTRAKGPSFLDIAKRYPIQKPYIELLARKIISGGSGSWGYPVMSPHTKLSEEDAQAMVWYIFSLDAN